MTKSGDALLGVINPKYTFVRQGVTVGFTADTDKNTKFEVSVEKLLPGLKLTTIVCELFEIILRDLIECGKGGFQKTQRHPI